ncbi:MAG: UDP-N-acetylmuramate dehydrogenase [Acetobacteraceae bacterium]|nr:UDP-N-acetylmuramate dehydrogenase [Acetobacteraceae bacterium]
MNGTALAVAGLGPLPSARGRLIADAPLGAQTWFRTGGVAEFLFRPADADDLAAFLRDLDPGIPVTVVGAGSNLLVRDGGVAGVVVRLPASAFGRIIVEPDGIVAGAAALDRTVAEAAAEAGLAGLAFLSGIPGSLGGAVAMNAGAYGAEVADVLEWADVVTRDGTRLRLAAHDLAFSYRASRLPAGAIVTGVRLRARRGNPATIAAEMARIRAARERTQPVRGRTGGSTFKNPPGAKAWELIEAAGCRGLRRGDAQVSEKHCNFLLNLGRATAADLEALGEEVRARVRAATGVELEWEIRRIGRPLPAGDAA